MKTNRKWMEFQVRTKDGRQYLPIECLPEYTGNPAVISQMRKMRLLMSKNVDGWKIIAPGKLLCGRRFSKLLWGLTKSDIEQSDREFFLGRPFYALKSEGVAELLRIHELKFPSGKIDENNKSRSENI